MRDAEREPWDILRAGGLVLAAGLSILAVLTAFGGSWRWPFALLDALVLAGAGTLGVVAIRRAPNVVEGRTERLLGYALAVAGFAAATGAAIVALAAAAGLATTAIVVLVVLAIAIIVIALSGGF